MEYIIRHIWDRFFPYLSPLRCLISVLPATASFGCDALPLVTLANDRVDRTDFRVFVSLYSTRGPHSRLCFSSDELWVTGACTCCHPCLTTALHATIIFNIGNNFVTLHTNCYNNCRNCFTKLTKMHDYTYCINLLQQLALSSDRTPYWV